MKIFLHKFNDDHSKKSRTEIYNIKKEETEGKIIKYHHIETIDSNKKGKETVETPSYQKTKVE